MNPVDEANKYLTRWSDNRFYLLVLAILATITATVATVFVLLIQRNFLTITCDTAFYQSGIVNLIHGNGFRDTAYDGPNVLGNHTTFVLMLLAPIYALLPSPDTLFKLQVWGVYSAVLPLYLVAREISGKPLAAFLIAGSALASPLFLHMAAAPFHPETWMAAAILWSFYFYRRNRPAGFWISFFFAVCCNEQAALVYVALGIAWLLVNDGVAWRKRYGKFALAGGLAWLAFAMGVVTPMMHSPGQQQVLSYHYDNWGADVKSAPQLAGAILGSPGKAASLLLSPDRWWYIAEIIGLPLLLVLGSRQALLLLLPFPFFFLMKDQEFFLYFHAYYYQFVFLAGYLALIYFVTRWDITTRVGATVMAVTIACNMVLLSPAICEYAGFAAGADDGFSDVLRQVFAQLPTEAAVYGPHRYSAYLSDRPDMVMGDLSEENLDFKKMLDQRFDVTDVHPEEIQYIVCDLMNDQCGWRLGGYDADKTKRRADNVQRLISSGQWTLLWSQQNVVILHRVKAN